MQSPSKQLSDGEFIDLLKQREQDAEDEARRWKKRFRVLLWFVVLFPVLGWHGVQCIVSPTYLTLSEDDTRTLYLHKRHWFRPETVERVDARRTDYGTVEWMKKYPNGEWSQAFERRDQ